MHNTIVYYFCVLSVCAAKLASMGVAESVRRETVPWRCRKQKPRSHPTPTAATTTSSSASSLRQRHKLGLNMSLFLLQLGEGRPLRMPQRPAGSPCSSRESALPWTANNADSDQQQTPFNKDKLQSHDVTCHSSRNSCGRAL